MPATSAPTTLVRMVRLMLPPSPVRRPDTFDISPIAVRRKPRDGRRGVATATAGAFRDVPRPQGGDPTVMFLYLVQFVCSRASSEPRPSAPNTDA